MDPQLTSLIVGAAITGIGWLGRTLYKSWQEARQGRKDEADRIADERDKYRTLKLRWKQAYYELSYLAAKRGVTDDELPRTPDDNH